MVGRCFGLCIGLFIGLFDAICGCSSRFRSFRRVRVVLLSALESVFRKVRFRVNRVGFWVGCGFVRSGFFGEIKFLVKVRV